VIFTSDPNGAWTYSTQSGGLAYADYYATSLAEVAGAIELGLVKYNSVIANSHTGVFGPDYTPSGPTRIDANLAR
jgi:hypothetical protein